MNTTATTATRPATASTLARPVGQAAAPAACAAQPRMKADGLSLSSHRPAAGSHAGIPAGEGQPKAEASATTGNHLGTFAKRGKAKSDEAPAGGHEGIFAKQGGPKDGEAGGEVAPVMSRRGD
ncbi:MAG: hypothetical protein JWM80_6467 [Cyanobacteria bacterium RYN_339]|nr:hypothetical protein [Cyanobacteria bacterium RYN_339]